MPSASAQKRTGQAVGARSTTSPLIRSVVRGPIPQSVWQVWVFACHAEDPDRKSREEASAPLFDLASKGVDHRLRPHIDVSRFAQSDATEGVFHRGANLGSFPAVSFRGVKDGEKPPPDEVVEVADWAGTPLNPLPSVRPPQSGRRGRVLTQAKGVSQPDRAAGLQAAHD